MARRIIFCGPLVRKFPLDSPDPLPPPHLHCEGEPLWRLLARSAIFFLSAAENNLKRSSEREREKKKQVLAQAVHFFFFFF